MLTYKFSNQSGSAYLHCFILASYELTRATGFTEMISISESSPENKIKKIFFNCEIQ